MVKRVARVDIIGSEYVGFVTNKLTNRESVRVIKMLGNRGLQTLPWHDCTDGTTKLTLEISVNQEGAMQVSVREMHDKRLPHSSRRTADVEERVS